jgi:wyosine [tRNA(Phe)-imidazoG37] synthetase (radical SAM superfamily)
MKLPKKTPEYEELKEIQPPLGLSYGPQISRRYGTTLGINFLGSIEKICSYDCPYCELGLTKVKMSHVKKGVSYPTPSEIDQAMRNHVLLLTKEKKGINEIVISGNGDPSLHPDFFEAVDVVKKARDELTPTTRIAILSNGANLDEAKIIRAYNLIDDKIIKMDAGNDEMLRKIGNPSVRVTITKLIQGIRKIKSPTIQTMFLQGAIDNTLPGEIDEWIEVVGIIKPIAVQLYSLDRIPPTSGLKQVSTQRLKEISLLLNKRTGIKGTVFS